MYVCSVVGCPTLIPKPGRCPEHARQADHNRGTRTNRGYGSNHVALRTQWALRVSRGTVNCARCGNPIHPNEPWHLDHDDDRTGYRGPSHARCNLAAAGRASHR